MSSYFFGKHFGKNGLIFNSFGSSYYDIINDFKTMTHTVKMTLEDGRVIDLPIVEARLGESGIDISRLYRDIGFFAYDPGFLSTASCTSKITYIDGEKGILIHRGYKIEDLAQNSDFISVAHLLLYGKLPNDSEKNVFQSAICEKMFVDNEVKKVVKSFDRKSHPMAIMMAAISVLAAKYGDSYSAYDVKKIDECSIDLIAKVAAIGGYVFRYISDLEEIEISDTGSFISRFISFVFTGTQHQDNLETIQKAFDKILILHADHEQNASTSSVRLTASTDVNLYAAVVSGFVALWGPLHGGANEAVINMLHEIGSSANIDKFIARAKDKNDTFKLMGFGHRIYKNYDPRATVLKSSCDEILNSLAANEETEILKIAKELEKTALNDEYFKSRKLFPNVDFYSGIIYQAMDFPSTFFTVIFGIARTAGWVSQVRESMLDSEKKISRPRQIYQGNVS